MTAIKRKLFIMTQTEVKCTFNALWCHHTLQTYFKACSILLKGSIGGAGKTFACKSQECLWQDWYIHSFIFDINWLLFKMDLTWKYKFNIKKIITIGQEMTKWHFHCRKKLDVITYTLKINRLKSNKSCLISNNRVTYWLNFCLKWYNKRYQTLTKHPKHQ